MDSTHNEAVDKSWGASGTLGLSEQPGRVSPLGPRRTGDRGVWAVPSLTTEGVSEARARVEALATLADEAIGGSQVFGTWTFRDPAPRSGSPYFTSVGHAGGVRAITGYLIGLADVYPGISAFVAMEPHKDRVAPHFHGLLAGLDGDVPVAIDAGRRGRRSAPRDGLVMPSVGVREARSRFWESWWTDHGMARLEGVTGNGAALYVSKYSLKGGDEVPWWRIWEPGELRHEWVRSTHKRRPR